VPAFPEMHDLPSAGRHVDRRPRRSARTGARKWRRRSRRAQVSAIATILGLLLVVTFIANYLTTTLPSAMGQNDLQREMLVQNQVSQLSILLQKVAAKGAVGSQVTQAVSLGSAATPPFAGADSGFIAPENSTGSVSPGFKVNFTLLGPPLFSPPLGYPAGGTITPVTDCPVLTATTITCSGSGSARYNFAGNSVSYTLGVTGTGFAAFNVSANSSASIAVADTSSGGFFLQVLGSHDTITITGAGSGPSNLTVIGSNDTVSISPTGASKVVILVDGNNDHIAFPLDTGTQTVFLRVYGSSDPLSASGFTSGHLFTYFNGFNAGLPTSSLCPFRNLSSTDSATFSGTGTVGLKVFYNNSVGYNAQTWHNSSCTGTCYFGQIYQSVATTTCPFFVSLAEPIGAGAPQSAAFVVHLSNTYAPAAEVAFEQGAVLYAQPGGLPTFVVSPRLTFVNHVLALFVPRFANPVGSEGGTGAVDVNLRLLTTSQVYLPTAGFSLQGGTAVTVTIVSPYAEAWYAYFQSYAGLSSYVSCTSPENNLACTGLYDPGGPLGTVTLSVPTAGLTLELLVGLYSINLS